jgi:hypothetical protein
MKLQKPDLVQKIAQIEFYKQKTLLELRSIIPNWAYGKNAEKILDYSLHPKNQEYIIFYVDPTELIANSELYEVNPNVLFTGELLNDSRIAGILSQWENNAFVDPPTVGLCLDHKSKLSLSDGRHRAKLTYILGHKQMPIAVHNSELLEIADIVGLSNI